MKVVLKSKRQTHYATGEYDGKGILIHKGSKINLVDSYPDMPINIRNSRQDRAVVSEDGTLLSDLYFSAPSGAAVFVTGRSTNGFIAWRPNDEMSLKEFLSRSSE